MDVLGVTGLPYDERRIIVVTDKVPAAAPTRTSKWSVLEHLAGMGWLGLSGSAAIALARVVRSFKENGEVMLPIDRKTARELDPNRSALPSDTGRCTSHEVTHMRSAALFGPEHRHS